jgi:hypothetical protein
VSEATQEAIRAALAAWLACSPQMRSTIVFGLRDDARCLRIAARNPDDPEQADASQCAARLLEVLGSGAMLTDKELDELLPAWLPQRPAPGFTERVMAALPREGQGEAARAPAAAEAMKDRQLPSFAALAALAAAEDLHDFRDLPLALEVSLPQLLRSAEGLPDEHPRASEVRKLASLFDVLVQLTGVSIVAGEAGDMALDESALTAAGALLTHLGESRPLFGLAVAASLRRADRDALCSACRTAAYVRPLYVLPRVSERSVMCVACWKGTVEVIELRANGVGAR